MLCKTSFPSSCTSWRYEDKCCTLSYCSPSPFVNTPDWCCYHMTIGANARQCRESCSYRPQGNDEAHNLLMVTSSPGLYVSLLLFLLDHTSRLRFLVDTGTEMSIVPPTVIERKNRQESSLHAANNSAIATFGEGLIQLDLGWNCSFPWVFVFAYTRYSIQVRILCVISISSSTSNITVFWMPQHSFVFSLKYPLFHRCKEMK